MTPEQQNTIIGAVLGASASAFGSWALFLLQGRADAKTVREGLRVEFIAAKDIMAMKTFLIATHLGTRDRKFLEWLQITLENHKGSEVTQTMTDTIKSMLAQSDAQFAAMPKLRKATDDKGLSLKVIELPFFDANLGKLSSLSVEEQSEVLAIRTCVRLVNQEVEQNRFYYETTFAPGISPENVKQLKTNSLESYDHILRLMRRAVDKIKGYLDAA